MKNKNNYQNLKSLISITILLISFGLAFAADESKPVAGYVRLSNGDYANNAGVIVRANVGKNNDFCNVYLANPGLFPQFAKYCYGCNCSTKMTYTFSNGIYVENLGNLVHDNSCDITSDYAGGECGDDWSLRTENTVWADVYGSFVNPPQGNGSIAARQITAGGGTQWLDEITLPAGPDLPPKIVSILPTGWVNTQEVLLIVETNEFATCKYSTSSKDYNSKEFTLNGNTRYHNKTVILSEGDNRFYIQCKDDGGLLSNEEYTLIKLDSSAPLTTDNFDRKWHNTDILVSLDTNCDISGCEWTKYCLGQNCIPDIFYSGAIMFTDYNYLRYHSKDNAGNIEDIKTTEIKVDKEAPNTFDNYAVGVVYPYDIYVVLTSSCGISGCEWTKYCVGDANCVPDTNYAGAILFTSSAYLRYHSRDFAGNTQEIQTVYVQIDKKISPTSPGAGGGGSTESARRHYPGILPELESPKEYTPGLISSLKRELNITLPEEVVVERQVQEKMAFEAQKASIWMRVLYMIILIIIVIIIYLLIKKKYKLEED